jgi:Tfp pilus assembly protein PilN
MTRLYSAGRKEITYGRRRSPAGFLIVVVIVAFAFVSFFMMNSHTRSREHLIEMLKKESAVMERNNQLKTELAGITRTRFLELKAKERLGLQKPKEEEVLVLR